MALSTWIQDRIAKHGLDTVGGVQVFCDLAAELGGDVFIPSTQGSIITSWSTDDRKLTYPFGVYPSGIIVLRLGYLKNRPAYRSDASRQALYDKLTSIVGPLHTQSLAGEPGFPAALLNDDLHKEQYRIFMEAVVAEAKVAD